MNHYFISDAHLYPSGKQHPGREPLKSFLRKLAGNAPGKLWILGDLFDYWFEYNTVIPAGFSDILSLLKNLSDKGWQVFFMPGNHDWWCGNKLATETGMQIILKTTHCEVIDDRKTVMAHGDGLGSGDTGYRIMKPVLRSTAIRFLFSMLHPTLATGFAGIFSNTSKRIFRKQVDSIPEYLTRWIVSQSDKGTDLVITGHTHCPSLVKHGNLIHASLGDWISHFTYLRVGGGEINLHEYQE
ncbi:MAG: UDP-2,3-diacylglucosamine diphosphatase [Candidatus Sabulitectum sp.]|nr:UDP-2,3-diacylglucosamine diphosphatase [Candidatus Sabulitectum sp.]